MWTVILGIFLLFHGLIHLAYVAPAPADPNYPFDLNKSWLIASTGIDVGTIRLLGMVFAALTAIGFLLAALATMGIIVPQTWWQPLTVTAALASLVLLFLGWHNWLLLGVAIDVLLLVAVFVLHWQPFSATAT